MSRRSRGSRESPGDLRGSFAEGQGSEKAASRKAIGLNGGEHSSERRSGNATTGGRNKFAWLVKLPESLTLRELVWFHSLATVAIYIIMIEGLGKGVKYSLFVANAIIFMGGVIVFSIGVWTLNDRSFMERLLGTNLYVASAAILIVTGSIVAIISFLGTFGAYKEVKCMLLTYFVILVILFIVMVTAGILGYVFRLEVDDRMQQEMHSTIKLYGNDTAVTQAWDAVQAHFQCCGITMRPARGYELWRKENVHFRSETGPVVPGSCCRSQEDDPIKKSCQSRQPRREDTFYEGCYERMKEFVKSHALLVGGMAIGVSCLIIFGIILSCALYMMIK